MVQFVAFDKDVEVIGQTVLSVVDGMGPFRQTALRILAEAGIPNPRPEEWYSQQKWLDAFRVLSDRIGPKTLFQIGEKIPENAIWPPHVDDVPKALASIDVAYHMNHRRFGKPLFDPKTGKTDEGIGHYRFEPVSSRRARVICDNPYPCDFDRGIVESAARKFAPKNAKITVEHTAAHSCRNSGAAFCTYDVSW